MYQKIKKGTVVTLTDLQTISKLASEKTQDVTRLDLVAKSVEIIREQNALFEYRIISFEEEDLNLFLVFKIVGEVFDAMVFFKPEYPENVKGEIVERGDYFLFNEPEQENWVPSDLEWTDWLEFGEEGFDKQGTYICKNGEYYTEITEYLQDGSSQNPRLMIVELGGAQEHSESEVEASTDYENDGWGGVDEIETETTTTSTEYVFRDEGGWVTLYRGAVIDERDIEIL